MMARVLFVTWDGGGNVPPAVALARELARQGHEVEFMGHASQALKFQQAGIQFLPFSSPVPFEATRPHSLLGMLGLFSDRRIGRDVLNRIGVRGYDRVVVDCLLFGVMGELQRAGAAYVVFEHLFDAYLRKALHGPMGLLLRLQGVRPAELLRSATTRIVATLPELDPIGENLRQIGPLVRGSQAEPAQTTLLVSLSTFAYPSLLGTWQRVLDAVEGLQVPAIATIGPALDVARLRIPSNVEVFPWLPHEEIMPKVSLVVSHGGHSTAMAALAHGLPLLALPLDAKTDQPLVGRAIETAGAGRVLSRGSSAAKLRAGIETMLGNNSYRGQAEKLGQSIRRLTDARLRMDVLDLGVSGKIGSSEGLATTP